MDDAIRKVLERPFPNEVLRQRQGAGGKVFTYAPLQAYLDRLQEAFGGNWSFAITRREQIEDQLLVEGRLSVAGVDKSGLGGAQITRRRDDGRMVDLGNDYKRAEADAIKRCCRLLGIGRELFAADDDEAVAPAVAQRPAPVAAQAPRSVSPPERQRLTSKQLNAIWAIARNQGYGEVEFRSYCVENFGAQPEFLSRTFASQIIEQLGRRSNGNGHAERAPGEDA